MVKEVTIKYFHTAYLFISPLTDDGFISVYNQEIRGTTGEFDDACGTACQPDPDRPGELVVTFGPVTDSKGTFRLRDSTM